MPNTLAHDSSISVPPFHPPAAVALKMPTFRLGRPRARGTCSRDAAIKAYYYSSFGAPSPTNTNQSRRRRRVVGCLMRTLLCVRASGAQWLRCIRNVNLLIRKYK